MIIPFPQLGYVSSPEGMQFIPWVKLSRPELIGFHWGGGSATLTLWLTRPQQAVDFFAGDFLPPRWWRFTQICFTPEPWGNHDPISPLQVAWKSLGFHEEEPSEVKLMKDMVTKKTKRGGMMEETQKAGKKCTENHWKDVDHLIGGEHIVHDDLHCW